MTGYYVRVEKDDGSFGNLDIAELSDTELDRFIKDKINSNPNSQEGWQWVRTLASWIRDNVGMIK